MNKSCRPNRRGAAIVCALVCLVMAAALAAVVTRIAVLGWQGARDEGRRAQAAWLVQSGLERAAARLATEPDYAGETWRIPADVLDGRHDAVVLIEVTTAAENPRQRTVRVRADYPDDLVDRIRKSKQLVVTLPPEIPKSQNPEILTTPRGNTP